MSDLDSVRVAVRVRPMVPSELARGCQVAVERVPGMPQVVVNNADAFTFNYVFDSTESQEQVYTECVLGMLDRLFCGFNATILAYGQTGSGKTHTMGTAFDGTLDENVGVIPRAMHDIFERIKQLANEYEFTVKCSFMELYQEQLYDLLSSKSREDSVVDMREDRNGIIMVGLTELEVYTALETTNCLVRGSTGRAVASTAMNQQSSRSHAIFTVTVVATKKDDTRNVTTSKFHLVDLAGSERSKKTQATGDRFKEGVKINQGLLTLGNVISALGSGQGSGYVRYRDSKLTRLLQDSLGGNSYTLMIACVSPADYNVVETLSTLRYADRARKIKNKPIINQDPHAAEVNRLKGIIQKLRIELLAKGCGISSSLTGDLESVVPVTAPPVATSMTAQSEVQALAKLYRDLQEKYRSLQQQLQVTLHDVAENEMRAHIVETSHDKLRAKTTEMKSIVRELTHGFAGQLEGGWNEEKFEGNLEKVQQISRLVEDLNEELERTQSEICDQKRLCSSVNGGEDDNGVNENDGGASLAVQELMQEQAEAYTNKQIGFKEQLRRINWELGLKEELQQRVACNLNKFCTLDDNIEEKFKECESKIQELEAEKNELLDKLRHVKENVSAKLAEERRKRLQALEQEINEMKRKNIQQSKLLKVREKEAEKIRNLNKEIQTMKESKVKLIRAMRQESENFRQWKLLREKELVQLRNKDRKMQNEMVRKEALHTKQRNVLKRKCEEAMAINKRLKVALERQKVAQSQRHKLQSSKNFNSDTIKMDDVIAWAERELEVIVSLIDAEHTLEQLMDDRGIISSRIAEIQRQQPAPEPDTPLAEELANLLEEVEMRNAQISDLQQKVCATDLETRMSSFGENIQTLGEARAILQHLLKAIGEMRREYTLRSIEQKAAYEELRSLQEATEERCSVAAKRIRLMELEYEKANAEREKIYEEKIALLLRELHNAPQLPIGAILTPEQEERLKIQEEQLDKMEALREELESCKQLVAELQTKRTEKTARKRMISNGKKVEKEEDVDELTSFSEDDENDPDWRKTPLVRRRRQRNIMRRKSAKSDGSDVSAHLDETYVPAQSTVNMRGTTGADTRTSKGEQKRKFKSCSCHGNCSNRRCGCYSGNEKCTIKCRCSDACINGRLKAISDTCDEQL